MPSSIAPDREAVACPLCGRDDADTLLVKETFPVVRCRACGLVYVNPRPSRARLGALYQDPSYFEGGEWYDDYLGDADHHRRLFRRILACVERFTPPGRLLDVGCAAGFLLEAARRRGWRVAGVEPSAAMAEHARRTLGVEVRQGTLDDAGFSPASFDVVTLCDSIEHMTDPVAALREARRLLSASGLVVVVTPDVSSPLARMMGRRWPHLTPREHIVYFDAATLSRAFREAGFEPVHRQTIGHYFRLGAIAAKLAPGLAGRLRAGAARALFRPSIYLDVGDLLMIARARGKASTRSREEEHGGVG